VNGPGPAWRLLAIAELVLAGPAKLSPHQQQEVIKAVRDGSKTAADAARLFGVASFKYYTLVGTLQFDRSKN
jgi:hypothetical protein